ncbi:MAG: acyltransferase family protein [Betaproteobacteria bacterium]
MNYRPEIDGLRAIAVLPVIFFHAGLQPFRGGFVGVDVFFVISGYLIASIVLAERSTGHFSLVNFYERRARRILPALFFVMLACLPFAWLWLLPADFSSFSQSLVAVAGFFSNVLFWKTSGYFEAAAELKPLLHTWSLAVEEQFYLLFPMFLLLVWGMGRRRIAMLFSLLALLSLAMALWGATHKPIASFFLLPTRGWELLIGVLLAFHRARLAERKSIPLYSPLVAEMGGFFGLLSIAIPVFAFDRQFECPILYVLASTIGASLLILFATPRTVVGRILGSKALVGVGLISYSAYLWHQPLFAFARYRGLGEPSGSLVAALIAATFALAILSWRYVEKPFRNKERVSRRHVFAFSAMGTVLFTALGLAGQMDNGFESRLTEEQRKISAYSKYDLGALFSSCYLHSEKTYADFPRECSGAGGHDVLLIWGDSYSAALSRGVRAQFSNVAQYTASACPPVIDTVFVDRPYCFEINEFIKRRVGRLQPDRIFLNANWYLYGREGAAMKIEKTVHYIKKVSPGSRVTLVGSPPEWEPTLPVYALKRSILLDGQQYIFNASYKPLKALDGELRAIAERNGIAFLSVLESLCSEDQCLAVVDYKGFFELTAADKGHLTEAGSMFVAQKLFGSGSKRSDGQR